MFGQAIIPGSVGRIPTAPYTVNFVLVGGGGAGSGAGGGAGGYKTSDANGCRRNLVEGSSAHQSIITYTSNCVFFFYFKIGLYT